MVIKKTLKRIDCCDIITDVFNHLKCLYNKKKGNIYKMCKEVVEEIRKEDYTYQNVDLAAEKLLSLFAVKVPFPIVELSERMGFKIFLRDLPNGIGGTIGINGEFLDRFGTDKVILVNKKENGKRRRFTVAHELGHYLLDYKYSSSEITFYNYDESKDFENDKLFYAYENDETNDDANEILINRFAAELLMPKACFVKDFIDSFKGIYKKSQEVSLYDVVQILSEKYSVPPKSVQRRINELKNEINEGLGSKYTKPEWLKNGE